MDPQLEEYRRRQRERLAGGGASGSGASGASGRDDARAPAALTGARHPSVVTPDLGATEAPRWLQIGGALLLAGALWLNVVRPYLYLWLLLVGLLSAAAWVYSTLRREGESDCLASGLAFVQEFASSRHRIGDFDVVGWQAVATLLAFSLLLGPWVIGWAALAAFGAYAWSKRETLVSLAEAFVSHSKEQLGADAQAPRGAGGASRWRGRRRQ
mmetsp:Transcript_23315/g.65057  ORF Transcript_23315/g.65057 Transcript_23315/m.65057 type:complete len:213 (+) Transcript_23315:67-705(+)